MTTQHNA